MPSTVTKRGLSSEEKNPTPTLLENDESFRILVDSIKDYAIFMLDPEGRIASWNSGAERLNGYRRHEVIGRHFSIFYTEEARLEGHPDDELRQAKLEGRYEEEGWRIRKDGTQFWASVVITPLTDDAGRHIGFAKVTRDMTERRRTEELLRQSEERLRLLIESVNDYAIIMLDVDGIITTWNSGAQLITGYRPNEVIGRHFSLFYPPEALAKGQPEQELLVAAAEGRYEEEGWRLRKNGERYWTNVVIAAVHDPSTHELRGFAKVTRDLTEKRRLELEARQAENDAAAERTKAIEATTALKLRDEFISVASHELRTPLTALQLKVQGVTLALANRIEPVGAPTSKHAARLGAALRQIQRMTELVERLLDVSRIGQSKLALNLEETELTVLAGQVVEDFREPAVQSGSELTFHAAGTVVGVWDKARIEQVIINLLSNAIKYGRGQPIEVRVEAIGAGARLTITDHGIGIAPADVDRIFARFERAAPLRHYGGLGVGLYIARSIVDAHGGSIRVSSTPELGATFVVDLPERTPSADPRQNHREKSPA